MGKLAALFTTDDFAIKVLPPFNDFSELRFVFNLLTLKVKNDMAGLMYCKNSEFNTGDIQLCITWVEAIGILSVKTMGALLFVSAERICGDLGCE